MTNTNLVEQLQKEIDETYGRFTSIMPRALQKIIEQHVQKDLELQKCNQEQIQKVRTYMEQNLADILFQTAIDNTRKTKEDAKEKYKLCEYEIKPKLMEDADGYEYEGL